MRSALITEDDPKELEASRQIAHLLDKAVELHETFESHRTPRLGSRLSADDAKVPEYPVSQLTATHLVNALGNVEAFSYWLGYRPGVSEPEVTAHPQGGHAMLRSCLESAGLALWVLYPTNSKLRLRRCLAAHAKDWEDARIFYRDLGASTGPVDEKLRRLQQFGDDAGIEGWKARPKRVQDDQRAKVGKPQNALPTYSKLFKDVDTYPPQPNSLPFLSAWQLASGMAHGRFWAMNAAQELTEEEGTRHEYGAMFRMTASFTNLVGVLYASLMAVERAILRHADLGSTDGQPPPREVLPKAGIPDWLARRPAPKCKADR